MRRSHASLVAALFVGYASFYLCRANVEAAIPLLVHAGYGSRARLGALSSIATLAYAIGKLVMGAAGDALGGRRVIGLAVAGSVIFSLAFGTSNTFLAMVFFAAANRFFQSGGWSGVVHVVSRWFAPRVHGRIMGVLSTSYELGNVFALTLSGFVARWGWRALFVVNPLLFAVVGGSVVAFLPRSGPPADGSSSLPSASSSEESPPLATILGEIFRKGALWAALALSCLLTFLRTGFLTWTPMYLYELSVALGHEEISGAIVKSAVFPLAGIVAALLVGALSDRMGPGRRAPIMAASLALVVAFVLLLAHGHVREPLAATGVIAAIGFFLLGPYSLLAGAIALDVAGTRGTATATGIIDGGGYLMASAAPLVLGALVDRSGWSAAFDVLAGAAAIAALVAGGWSVVALRRRA
jgi:sugar phosphate permease